MPLLVQRGRENIFGRFFNDLMTETTKPEACEVLNRLVISLGSDNVHGVKAVLRATLSRPRPSPPGRFPFEALLWE